MSENILKSRSVTPKKTEGCNWCHSGFSSTEGRFPTFSTFTKLWHHPLSLSCRGIGCRLMRESLCQHNQAWKVKGSNNLWLHCGSRLHFYICTRYRKKVTPFTHISFPGRCYSLTGAPSCPLLWASNLPNTSTFVFQQTWTWQLQILVVFFFSFYRWWAGVRGLRGHTGTPFAVTWSPPDLGCAEFNGTDRDRTSGAIICYVCACLLVSLPRLKHHQGLKGPACKKKKKKKNTVKKR